MFTVSFLSLTTLVSTQTPSVLVVTTTADQSASTTSTPIPSGKLVVDGCKCIYMYTCTCINIIHVIILIVMKVVTCILMFHQLCVDGNGHFQCTCVCVCVCVCVCEWVSLFMWCFCGHISVNSHVIFPYFCIMRKFNSSTRIHSCLSWYLYCGYTIVTTSVVKHNNIPMLANS